MVQFSSNFLQFIYLKVAPNVLFLLRAQVFIQALRYLLTDREGSDPIHLNQIRRIPQMEKVTICEAPLVVVGFKLILFHQLIFEGGYFCLDHRFHVALDGGFRRAPGLDSD